MERNEGTKKEAWGKVKRPIEAKIYLLNFFFSSISFLYPLPCLTRLVLQNKYSPPHRSPNLRDLHPFPHQLPTKKKKKPVLAAASPKSKDKTHKKAGELPSTQGKPLEQHLHSYIIMHKAPNQARWTTMDITLSSKNSSFSFL